MDSGKRSALFENEYSAWSLAVNALGRSLEAGRARILQRPRFFSSRSSFLPEFSTLRATRKLELSCKGVLPHVDLAFVSSRQHRIPVASHE